MQNFPRCRFHSLHHTQFRTNYSLFMPFYDYIYNTVDKSSDDLYERKLKGEEETLHVVHLSHPTALQSIYHLRLGFPSLASKPYKSKWYMLMLWPISWLSMVLAWIYGSSITVERNSLKKLRMQTWAIPRYNFQVRNFIHKYYLAASTSIFNGYKIMHGLFLCAVWLFKGETGDQWFNWKGNFRGWQERS